MRDDKAMIETIEAAVQRIRDIPVDELGRLFWDSEEGCSDWDDLKAEHEAEEPEDRDASQYAAVCRAMEKVRERMIAAVLG
jgi:hypothetical protein